MPPEPLIEWPQPIIELLGFVASFLAVGAIGFRLGVLRRLLAPSSDPLTAADRAVFEQAARRAAVLGLVGAMTSAALLAYRLPGMAARRHLTVPGFVLANGMVAAQIALLVLAIVGLALASARIAPGWSVAAVGIVVSPFRSAFTGEWARLVNPLHMFAGGLWIGTLFMMVIAGITTVLGSSLASDRRGRAVAAMVRAFSPLALAASGALATFGVITAWLHLKYLSALWTTPYGYALITKLVVVAGVVALGAWNWRRQKPQLGSEAAARSLRRSALAELAVAGLVLIITAVLVSLPSPKPPVG